jgi:hypothetical protein
MEFLKQVKTPSSKKNDLLNINIEIKKQFTENNNEKLLHFLELLKKNINLTNFRYLSYAKKTDKTVILTQMDENEMKKNKQKMKMSILSNIQVRKEPKRKIPTTIHSMNENGELKEIKKPQHVDDLTNNNHESEYEFVSNYKKYLDDDTIFKVPLIQQYVLNNKMSFASEIRDKLAEYLNVSDKHVSDESSCDDSSKSASFDPLIHQELVKQYLNSYSPYRGLVLYHGLGSGKTCTSIGVIEAMKSDKKKIYILTPASLRKNYISQLKFCGSTFFQEDDNWEYVKFPLDATRDGFINEVHRLTKLSNKYLRGRSGVYLQRITPKGDNDFVKIDKKALNEQINEMIKSRFHFISYNGITMDAWINKYNGNGNYNIFDDSVVIVDEAHNFVSRIVNKLNVKGNSVSVEMYKKIISADNCNVVMLTGTPLINYPNELGVLFNLVSGCNPVIQIRCVHEDTKMINIKHFKETLEKLGNVDYITYAENTNTLKVMKNPYGFVNELSGKIKYDMNEKTDVKEFKDRVIVLLQEVGYEVLGLEDANNSMIHMQKKFPDTKDEFDAIFIDKTGNGLKNKQYFQTKIAGLVSYVGDKKELMPTIVSSGKDDDLFIEVVEMTENVMKHYDIARAIERALDTKMKTKKKDTGGKNAQSGSYKIFSRAACNFVFPSKMDRFSSFGPDAKNEFSDAEEKLNRPVMNIDKIEDLEEDQLELLTTQEMLTMNDGKYDTQDVENFGTNVNKKRRAEFSGKVDFLLDELTKNAYKYFDSDIEKLVNAKKMKIEVDAEYEINQENDLKLYSPKFQKMLKNILNEEALGLHLMYSNFRTLEGIGIFKILLEYYGYSEFKIVKSTNEFGDIEYNMEIGNAFYYNSSFETTDPEETPNDQFGTLNGRRFYALYTGKEGEEEKEITRNIYNGNFQNIPANIRKDIRKYFFNNNAIDMTNMYGEVINLLMISSSGAEGIDLKNVRYVHITEPYWHPVRIEQVIGRAKRICSHKDLPEELQNVTVFMYLLSYNKELLKEKESLYTQLINVDTDEDGSVITTDEKLLRIMKRKKKLMQHFLTAMKEASVDCLFNYEKKEKCLSFPLPKSGINPHKTQRTNLHYKDDAYENIKIQKTNEVANTNNERGEYIDKKVAPVFLKTKYVKVRGERGLKKRVGVDFTQSPPVAFDLEDKRRLGTLERLKNDNYILTIDK